MAAKGIRASSKVLWAAVDVVTGAFVLATLLAVALQVISRLGGLGLAWTEETTRFVFMWAVFLGMAAGFRRVSHARISMLGAALPAPIRVALRHLYVLVGSAFFLAVIYDGVQLTGRHFAREVTSPALSLNMGWVSMSVSVGAVLALLAHLESAYLDESTKAKLQYDRPPAEELTEGPPS